MKRSWDDVPECVVSSAGNEPFKEGVIQELVHVIQFLQTEAREVLGEEGALLSCVVSVFLSAEMSPEQLPSSLANCESAAELLPESQTKASKVHCCQPAGSEPRSLAKRHCNTMLEAFVTLPPDAISEYKKSFMGIKYEATEEAWIVGSVEINQALLPLKLMMFTFYGAMAALLPYVTVHMQALGISIGEIATIYAVLPFTSVLGQPITGFIADKLGNYKSVLSLSIFLTGFFHTTLLFVPAHFDARNVTIGLEFSCLEDHSYFNLIGAQTNEKMRCKNPELPPYLTFANCTYSCTHGRTEKICAPSGQCFSQIDLYKVFPEDPTLSNFTNSSTFLPPGKSPVVFPIVVYDKKNKFLMDKVDCACPMFCEVVEEASQSCPMVGDENLTFWLYFLFRIFATVFMGAAFSLLDATALSIVRQQGKEYGKQRLWGILAMAICSPITGILVDVLGSSEGYTDYSSAFYVSAVMSIANILLGSFLKFHVEPAKEDLLSNLGKILKLVEADVFLVMMLLMGVLYGFVESYLFIYLKDLGASNYLLGATLTMGSVAGIPFLYGAENIVNKVGRINTIIFAFFVYGIRFIGYSYIDSPWWCFPFEALEAFTYHLMWVAAATYVTRLAPGTLLATMTGIMGAVHLSVGKGVGSFAGGHLISAFGMKQTFQYAGVFAAVVGLAYLMIHHSCLKQRIKERRRKEAAEVEKRRARVKPQSRRVLPSQAISRIKAQHKKTDQDSNYSSDAETTFSRSTALTMRCCCGNYHPLAVNTGPKPLGIQDQPQTLKKTMSMATDFTTASSFGQASSLGNEPEDENSDASVV